MKLTVIFFTCFIALNLKAQNVGVGTASPSQKLEVVGNLRVSGAIMPAGAAGANGQALTSNGPGLAPTWENQAYSGGGRFWLIPGNNARSTGGFTGRGGFNIDGSTAPSTQEDSLDILSSYETGSDFTIYSSGLTNNYISVARTGLYHFEGNLRYNLTSTLSVIQLPRATLDFVANQPSAPDINFLLVEDLMEKINGTETSSGINGYTLNPKFQFNIHLEAGTTFTLKTGFTNMRFPAGADLTGLGISQGGYISGHFISE